LAQVEVSYKALLEKVEELKPWQFGTQDDTWKADLAEEKDIAVIIEVAKKTLLSEDQEAAKQISNGYNALKQASSTHVNVCITCAHVVVNDIDQALVRVPRHFCVLFV